MPFINGKVKVEELDHGRWQLLEELEYKGARDTFKVPEGFVTDFASVPGRSRGSCHGMAGSPRRPSCMTSSVMRHGEAASSARRPMASSGG